MREWNGKEGQAAVLQQILYDHERNVWKAQRASEGRKRENCNLQCDVTEHSRKL